MVRPFKDDAKRHRLTWRYSDEYQEVIEELMYISGMTKSEVMEFVFDFYKHHIAAQKVKSRSR